MKRRRAFTIVELVIVIAVVAILAAVLIPTFSAVVRKAKDSYFLQNKRNEALEDFADSMLDEDYVTVADNTIYVSDDDARINDIKKDLSLLFKYLLDQSENMLSFAGGTNRISLNGIESGFFDTAKGYSYVGWYGYGMTRMIYSYEDKYIILYHYYGDTSSFEIRFYDDVVIQNAGTSCEGEIDVIKRGEYYKLKVVKDEDTGGVSESPNYKIEVVKYIESQN